MAKEASVGRPIRFNILGSLEVLAEQRPVTVRGILRRRTLTMLLLEAGRVVPISRLVEAAWDEGPPESAAHQIRKTVSELRRRIPSGAELIQTDGPGYRVVTAAG